MADDEEEDVDMSPFSGLGWEARLEQRRGRFRQGTERWAAAGARRGARRCDALDRFLTGEGDLPPQVFIFVQFKDGGGELVDAAGVDDYALAAIDE